MTIEPEHRAPDIRRPRRQGPASPARIPAAAFLLGAAVLLVLLADGPTVRAQTPPAQSPPDSTTPLPDGPFADGDAPTPPDFDDAYQAYEAGVYDQALAGFLDRQVARPEDPEVRLNVGASHYKMGNYDAAEREFREASRATAPEVQAEAFYNLGNTAYRQGKLQEAVDQFKRTLDLRPDDEDAKYNLEFVRNEIRRRVEENEQRQQQQQQQQDQEQQQEQNGESGDQGAPPQDQDGDGLGDETERRGANPTDPENPDTDGDGLSDGEEDKDRDGEVDPGETDPNRRDTDGDGRDDGEDEEPTGSPEERQGPDERSGDPGDPGDSSGDPRRQGAEQPAGAGEMQAQGLTPEEAERYLQALAEGRPLQPHKLPKGRRGRPAKDW